MDDPSDRELNPSDRVNDSDIVNDSDLTGAPRSPQRTWDEKDGRSPSIALERDKQQAFEENRYRPTYAGANVGHPSRGPVFAYKLNLENADVLIPIAGAAG